MTYALLHTNGTYFNRWDKSGPKFGVPVSRARKWNSKLEAREFVGENMALWDICEVVGVEHVATASAGLIYEPYLKRVRW